MLNNLATNWTLPNLCEYDLRRPYGDKIIINFCVVNDVDNDSGSFMCIVRKVIMIRMMMVYICVFIVSNIFYLFYLVLGLFFLCKAYL